MSARKEDFLGSTYLLGGSPNSAIAMLTKQIGDAFFHGIDSTADPKWVRVKSLLPHTDTRTYKSGFFKKWGPSPVPCTERNRPIVCPPMTVFHRFY